MMNKKAVEMLYEGAKEFGIQLSEEQMHMFCTYSSMLKERNKVVNLTAITEDEDIAVKHFLDSLTLYPYIQILSGNSLIDIGTGAGFPGIPLKIVCPDMKVTLVDSLIKRVAFLNDVVDELGLKNIHAIHARAEEVGKKKEHREMYDFATARAVAQMPVLLEYCLPLVKVSGYFLAMKGSKEEDNYDKALEVIGGSLYEKEFLELYNEDEVIKRIIYVFKKDKHTSTNYPRKPGMPTKKPLA